MLGASTGKKRGWDKVSSPRTDPTAHPTAPGMKGLWHIPCSQYSTQPFGTETCFLLSNLLKFSQQRPKQSPVGANAADHGLISLCRWLKTPGLHLAILAAF